MRQNPRELVISDKGSWLTQGICKGCGKKFVSRIREADTAEWEIKVQFERHQCKPPLPPTKSQ